MSAKPQRASEEADDGMTKSTSTIGMASRNANDQVRWIVRQTGREFVNF